MEQPLDVGFGERPRPHLQAVIQGRVEQVDREVQMVRLSEAKGSPALMLDVIEQGRVLVDRDDLWEGLQKRGARARRLARRAEKVAPVALEEDDFEGESL